MAQGKGKGAGGKTWTRKGAQGAAKAESYPVKVCSTRWKSPVDGQFTAAPADQDRGKGRAKVGKRRTGALIVTRSVTTYADGSAEVTGARVIHGGLRAGQRRGKVTKHQVKDVERDLSREYLAQVNPRLAQQVDSEAMHEAHRSAKAKRGAATRKAAPRTKTRSVAQVQTELLKVEARVQDAKRRHQVARTPSSREKHRTTISRGTARLAQLRRELKGAQR